ncbi:SDR family oxidoreductase [Betaproteobacteria bacterium PRO7]|nr:SDR family oxidoreductase [Betaproteobacteria bacterium PRO7]GIL05258.1 MAG: NAD-dependent dehydratase [Betaproteobacteria bacterium]
MQNETPAGTSRSARVRRGRRFGRPRLLIIGCGDIGLRILARLRDRYRVIALTSTPARVRELRCAGALPIAGDLDARATLVRCAPFGERVIHLAPPPNRGRRDPRTRHLLAVFAGRSARLVYVSTTGVYGDARGAWLDETARAAPANERAYRRVDAEHTLRRAGASGALHVSILRVPGIYDERERLPLERLRQGLPALAQADDVHTNHIHADDLARIAITALHRGAPQRVYNAVDDSDLKMGEYFDLVAERFDLPRPPRLPRDELKTAVSPTMYSFMSESRRLRNARIKRELRVRLRHPTVAAALAGAGPR